MSEEAKVGVADEAIAIVSIGIKDGVKRRQRFCKKSWNSTVYRDSYVESDTDDSSDSLEYHPCTVAPPRFLLFVIFAQPIVAFVSIFVFAILPEQLQEKPSYGKIASLPQGRI